MQLKPQAILVVLTPRLVMGDIGQLTCTERAEKRPAREEQLR